MILAEVAIPVPLGQAFTYQVPARLRGEVRRGTRVLCEFSRRQVLGVVLEVREGEPAIAPEKVKDLSAVVDREPVMAEGLLDFLLELARYYLAPVGEVMRLALPALERSQREVLDRQGLALGRGATVGRLVQVARARAECPPEFPLRGQAQEILNHLLVSGPTEVRDLAQRWGNARAVLQRLCDRGLCVIERQQREADPFFSTPVERDSPPELNRAQREAVAVLCGRLDAHERGAFLLQGVTASGKTEVYLHAAVRCLEQGGGAIVLVPEISLTPQLSARFRARLGDNIAVLHSGLTDAARHQMWTRLRKGELRVAVGARSALFAPVEGLRLICVDEEHDASFKQEEGVRYHARDMALLRAHRAKAVCVLGSATPSIEAEALVRSGKLERLLLPERARTAMQMPRIEIVDLRRVGPAPTGDRRISVPLYRALERALEAREQTILFLNRRGFAPYLYCESCGNTVECRNCAVGLTFHRTGGEHVVCHYCGEKGPLPAHCETCRSPRIGLEGAGTERIEAALTQAFPGATVARLDRDVASGLKSDQVLSRMRRGEIDILVGTQMVTKGHDLPRVTLVGVLNADAGLSLPDFRAAERTFQLLVQVAGRAGRGDAPGTVLIQTRNPEHYALAHAARHDVGAFLQREIAERRELGYPPFSRLGLVRVDGADEAVTSRAAEDLARIARRAARKDIRILGPSPAPIPRLRTRYRFQFLVRSQDRPGLRAVLLAVTRAPADRRVHVVVDVDPVAML